MRTRTSPQSRQCVVCEHSAHADDFACEPVSHTFWCIQCAEDTLEVLDPESEEHDNLYEAIRRFHLAARIDFGR